MRRIVPIAFVLALLAWPAPGPAGAAEIAGVVRNAAGPVSITRGGQAMPAAAGTRVFAGDTVATGAGASVGIILRDNSTLSLGPESSAVLRDFAFSPRDGKLALLVRVTKGTLAYISGLIARLSPEAARFETPVATIGFRGTRFAVRLDE